MYLIENQESLQKKMKGLTTELLVPPGKETIRTFDWEGNLFWQRGYK